MTVRWGERQGGDPGRGGGLSGPPWPAPGPSARLVLWAEGVDGQWDRGEWGGGASSPKAKAGLGQQHTVGSPFYPRLKGVTAEVSPALRLRAFFFFVLSQNQCVWEGAHHQWASLGVRGRRGCRTLASPRRGGTCGCRRLSGCLSVRCPLPRGRLRPPPSEQMGPGARGSPFPFGSSGLPLPPTRRAWRPRHVPGPERLSSRSVGTKRPRLGPMTAPPTSSPAPKVRALPSPQGSAGTRACHLPSGLGSPSPLSPSPSPTSPPPTPHLCDTPGQTLVCA